MQPFPINAYDQVTPDYTEMAAIHNKKVSKKRKKDGYIKFPVKARIPSLNQTF